MRWRHAQSQDLEPLISFLRPREYLSISLSSRLLRRGGFAIPPSAAGQLLLGFSSSFKDQGKGEPQAVVFRTSGGLLLPLFHERLQAQADDMQELAVQLRQGGRIYCVLGMRRDVEICAALQPYPIDTSRRYYLMRRLNSMALPPAPQVPGLQINRLNRRNASRVFPLEEAYQREEVMVHPNQFNATAHFLHFTRSIRRNRIYFAEIQGTPVAKAGTNAIGSGYCQIGGVFTVPEYRGRGISRALMASLLQWIYDRGQSAVLFVDAENKPACRLYKGLDFEVEGDYEILYTKLD